MNIKRIFGSALTVLGVIGLIYAGYTFMNSNGQMKDTKALVIYGILGLVFFMSGISLVKATKDES